MKLSDLEAVVALARARQDLQQAAAVPAHITVDGPFTADSDMIDVLGRAYSAELTMRAGEVEAKLASLGVEV